jgi:hypothetical protein
VPEQEQSRARVSKLPPEYDRVRDWRRWEVCRDSICNRRDRNCMIVSKGECVARYQDMATARDGSVRSRAVCDTRDTLIYRVPNCRAARIWRVSALKVDVEIWQQTRLHFWGRKYP